MGADIAPNAERMTVVAIMMYFIVVVSTRATGGDDRRIRLVEMQGLADLLYCLQDRRDEPNR